MRIRQKAALWFRPCYGALIRAYVTIPVPVRRAARKALGLKISKTMYLYPFQLSPGDAARDALDRAGWPDLDPEPRKVAPQAETRVLLHLHYPALWPEFEAMLKTIPGEWGLIVTLTSAAAAVEQTIHQAFPGATVLVVENRGRDIGPFFELVHGGALDGARLVCKLHGKRSLSNNRPQLAGELWRRSAVLALVSNADRVIGLFRERPDVGIVGPGHLLVPNSRFPKSEAWGGVRSKVEELLQRLRIDAFDLELFAGSMFWISGEAIAALRELGLRQRDFEDEAAFSEQGLAHAGERVFIPVVRHAGLRVGLLPVAGGEISILPGLERARG